MNEHRHTANKELKHLKGSKKREAQARRLYAYLRKHTVGRWMAAEAVGMPLQSVCWAIRDLRNADAVAVVRKDKCAISGEWVEYLTTDPDKFPKSNQLKLSLR